MEYMQRVEYYNKTDAIHGYMFTKSVEFIKKFDYAKIYSINEILEIYNVLQYLNDYVNDDSLSSDFSKIVCYENIKKLNSIIGKFFNTIDDSNFYDIIGQVEQRYKDCIWKLIEKYKVYLRISSSTFIATINDKHILVSRILANKNTVGKFDNELKTILLNKINEAVNILIEVYFKKKKKNIYLPTSLTIDDKEQIFAKYVESNDSNMNILETIANLPVNKSCLISDFTRAKAIEKHQKLVNEFFDKKDGIFFSTNIRVGFSKTLSEYDAYKLSYDENNLKITVSNEWIKNNLDYPTLLNNFIHIFGLVDDEFRIRNISKPASFSIFEEIFSNSDLVNYYQTDISFQLLNNFVRAEVVAYCEYLKSQFDIRIESVLQWFFDTYIKNEFDIKDFFVNMPSAGSTYLEKCRTICSEMESVVKQYKSLASLGYIDHDVIENSCSPVEYSNIESLIDNKYIYLDRKKCNNVLYLLFSDQSILTYLSKREGQEHQNLFDLLYYGKLNISEYESHQVNVLKTLQDEKIISISQDGNISFVNVNEVILLHDIYKNEFATTNFYRKNKLNIGLKSLESRNWIIYESCLLSKQESDYFNYYLNKSIFTNGFNLRNKYSHGTQKKRGNDENLHKLNYYTLLMLFVLLVIKINEELCINDDNKQQIEKKKNGAE